MKNNRLLVCAGISVGVFILMMLLMWVVLSAPQEVHAEDVRTWRYESIEIREGDSLWSLAEAYKPADMATRTYLGKLAELNGIPKDARIHAGNYLLVLEYE